MSKVDFAIRQQAGWGRSSKDNTQSRRPNARAHRQRKAALAHAQSTGTQLGVAAQAAGTASLPERIPCFYGWVMLGMAILAQLASSPGQTFIISVFNPSLQSDLHLTQSQLSGVFLLASLIACAPMSLIGGWMDRFGLRRVMLLGSTLFGLACIAISFVNSLMSLFFVMIFLRMIGQGALSLGANNTAAMWFHKRLGSVSGVMGFCMAAAIATFPLVVLMLIDQLGWRSTCMLEGMLVWAVLLPCVLIFYRDRPEDVGQWPDGIRPASAACPHSSLLAKPAAKDSLEPVIRPAAMPSLTLSETLRTRSFWALIVGNVTFSMVATGLMFHMVAFCAERGFSQQVAGASFTGLASAMAVMHLAGGFLADRYPPRWLLIASFSAMSLAVFCLATADSPWQVQAYAVIFGGGQGLFGAVMNPVWQRFFGPAHLGKIRGAVWTVVISAGSSGPMIMGLIKDLTGEFDLAVWIYLGMLAPAIPCYWFATVPAARKAPQPVQGPMTGPLQAVLQGPAFALQERAPAILMQGNLPAMAMLDELPDMAAKDDGPAITYRAPSSCLSSASTSVWQGPTNDQVCS